MEDRGLKRNTVHYSETTAFVGSVPWHATVHGLGQIKSTIYLSNPLKWSEKVLEIVCRLNCLVNLNQGHSGEKQSRYYCHYGS